MEEAVKARSKTPALGRVLCGLSTAAFCSERERGCHSLLHPAWAQKQALKRSAESNIYTEKEDIRSSGSGCSDILFLKIHF